MFKKNAFSSMFVGFLIFGLNFSPPNQSQGAIHQSQLSWYEVMHRPVVNEKKYEATAYLTLPFRQTDVREHPLNKDTPYNIYQGFIYSADELKIHKGNPIHGGIDYELPYGTPVVAPTDGYAMSSYMSSWVKDAETDETKTFQGKPIRYGFGYFVRMYIPSQDRYLDLAHLSDIDAKIPFSPPRKIDEGWMPTNYLMKRDEWKTSEHAVFVKRGTILGKVGYSGLGLGTEEEWKEDSVRPIVTDPAIFKSWDKPHIHFEEFSIDQETEKKGWQRDPYGIYDTFDYYPTPARHTKVGKDPIFLMNGDLPKYADE